MANLYVWLYMTFSKTNFQLFLWLIYLKYLSTFYSAVYLKPAQKKITAQVKAKLNKHVKGHMEVPVDLSSK